MSEEENKEAEEFVKVCTEIIKDMHQKAQENMNKAELEYKPGDNMKAWIELEKKALKNKRNNV